MYGCFQGEFFGLGGRVEVGVTWEDLFMEKLLVGEETFNEGGAGIFIIIYKNKEKINMKSFFSTESEEQH